MNIQDKKRSPIKFFKEFLALESAGGILLLVATAIALILENSSLSEIYHHILHLPLSFSLGSFELKHSLSHWINDGLMALFFLLVGLELKRERVSGALSNISQVLLPAIAALGGMIVPALFFYSVVAHELSLVRGWAIPCATDIAFALGILSLIGKGVPLSLKVFLTALAIFDDLGAIIIIALFYSSSVVIEYLVLASLALIALFLLNKRGVKALSPYLFIGAFLWFFVLKSGVHATLAGVALALFIPYSDSSDSNEDSSPLETLEHALHPWVAFGVLPIFAIANAGVNLSVINLEILFAPVTLGITLGLFLGKQIGVVLFCYFMFIFKLAKLPEGATKLQFYGVALLTGVGFTMSLFVGMLAFPDPTLLNEVRLGVVLGSLLSAVAGGAILFMSNRKTA